MICGECAEWTWKDGCHLLCEARKATWIKLGDSKIVAYAIGFLLSSWSHWLFLFFEKFVQSRPTEAFALIFLAPKFWKFHNSMATREWMFHVQWNNCGLISHFWAIFVVKLLFQNFTMLNLRFVYNQVLRQLVVVIELTLIHWRYAYLCFCIVFPTAKIDFETLNHKSSVHWWAALGILQLIAFLRSHSRAKRNMNVDAGCCFLWVLLIICGA